VAGPSASLRSARDDRFVMDQELMGQELDQCCRACSLDGFCADDLIGLRAFGALNDVELNFVAFLEAFVAVKLDRAVVDENVRASFVT